MRMSKPSDPVEDRLPLTEMEFFILLSISSGPQHGYPMLKIVSSLSAGRISLGTGTLYGALKRMLENGWILRREEKESKSESGRIRKLYALTPRGKDLLQGETRRLKSLVQAARRMRAMRLGVGWGQVSRQNSNPRGIFRSRADFA
jgi:DNA-binding PadR family transcriptional regulator